MSEPKADNQLKIRVTKEQRNRIELGIKRLGKPLKHFITDTIMKELDVLEAKWKQEESEKRERKDRKRPKGLGLRLPSMNSAPAATPTSPESALLAAMTGKSTSLFGKKVAEEEEKEDVLSPAKRERLIQRLLLHVAEAESTEEMETREEEAVREIMDTVDTKKEAEDIVVELDKRMAEMKNDPSFGIEIPT